MKPMRIELPLMVNVAIGAEELWLFQNGRMNWLTETMDGNNPSHQEGKRLLGVAFHEEIEPTFIESGKYWLVVTSKGEEFRLTHEGEAFFYGRSASQAERYGQLEGG